MRKDCRCSCALENIPITCALAAFFFFSYYCKKRVRSGTIELEQERMFAVRSLKEAVCDGWGWIERKVEAG